jgi:hypothetical protein
METSESERRIMRALDEVYMIDPCIGSRRLAVKLREGYGMETNRLESRTQQHFFNVGFQWSRLAALDLARFWHWNKKRFRVFSRLQFSFHN